MKYESPQLTDM